MFLIQIYFILLLWLGDVVDIVCCYFIDEECVGLVIELLCYNVVSGSGGLFGVVVFDGEGWLIVVGVNCVILQNCLVVYVEMMVYMGVQQWLQCFCFNEDGGCYVLVISVQLCCQCYGVIVWVGIDELLIGVCVVDVEELIEFDEGLLLVDWIGELECCGIVVCCDILCDEVCIVLVVYGESGLGY